MSENTGFNSDELIQTLARCSMFTQQSSKRFLALLKPTQHACFQVTALEQALVKFLQTI